MTELKRVVILGGGSAGYSVARTLDDLLFSNPETNFNVWLIDRKSKYQVKNAYEFVLTESFKKVEKVGAQATQTLSKMKIRTDTLAVNVYVCMAGDGSFNFLLLQH